MSEPEQLATVIDPPRAIRVKTSTGWADLVIQGPLGPTGPTGPTGPQGPQGAQGVPGPSYTLPAWLGDANGQALWITDWNSATYSGFYRGGSAANAPTDVGYNYFDAWVVKYDGNNWTQLLAGLFDDGLWFRRYASAYGPWLRVPLLDASRNLNLTAALNVAAYVIVRSGQPEQVSIGALNQLVGGGPQAAGIGFGSAVDVILYRDSLNRGVGAPALRTSRGFVTDLGVQAFGGADPTFLLGYTGNRVFQIRNTGRVEWGPGGTDAVDTSLYRSAAGQLKTDSLFMTNSARILAGFNAAWTVWMGDMGPSGESGVSFGSAGDTRLYRYAANQLKTDGRFLAVGDATYVYLATPAAAGGYSFAIFVGAEAQARFTLASTGQHNWGPGGSTAPDTTLYRNAANQLKTDGGFYAVGASGLGWSGSAWALQADSTGFFSPRVKFPWNGAGGDIVFQGDTNLYRASAANVRTDGSLSAAQSVIVDAAQAGNRLYLGGALDTSLRRTGVGVMRTDGTIDANALTVNGVPVGTASVPYGTTLPASPVDGQEAILVNSTTAPTYQWRLRYNASSTSAYKWECLGGIPTKANAGGVSAPVLNPNTWTAIATLTMARAGVYQCRGYANFYSGSGTTPTAHEFLLQCQPANQTAAVSPGAYVGHWSLSVYDFVTVGAGGVITLGGYSTWYADTINDYWLEALPVRVA